MPEPTTPAPRGLAPLLAFLFALMAFVSTGIATHLPSLLQAAGATLAAAVMVASLVGPAQVLARLLDVGLLRRLSPLLAARAAALGHPLGAALLLGLGGAGAVPFAVLHGLGNGLSTIVRGTLPLVLFGAAGYGARQGWLMLPARVLGALSPWLFGLALARWGVGALWLTGACGTLAFAGMLWLRLPVRQSLILQHISQPMSPNISPLISPVMAPPISSPISPSPSPPPSPPPPDWPRS